MKKITNINQKIYIFIYWTIITLLAFFIHWFHLIDADEGINLDGGWRILHGQIPYIDYFEFKTPGVSYVLATVFKIFGPSYMVAKIFSIIFLIISAVGIFYISKLILTRRICTYLAPLLWIFYSSFYSIINLNHYSGFSLIWAFYFFLRASKDNKNSFYFISGILSGATFWFLQTKGAVIIFASCFLTLIYNFKNLKKLIYFFAGLILSLLPFLYWPISTLYYNFLEFPIKHYLPINQCGYFFYFYALIIYLIFYFALKIHQKKLLLFLWWTGVFLLLINFYRSDIFHIVINCWPLIIIMFYSLEYDIKKIKPWIFFGLGAYICLVIAMTAMMSAILSYSSVKNFKDWVVLKNYALNEIIEYIKINSEPDDYIYSGPFLANFYLESQRKSPTKFQNLISSHYPPQLLETAAAEFKKNPPKIILLNYEMVNKFGHDKNNAVDSFIWENYELDLELYGVQVLKIKKNLT